jgi:prepilin-type N-terminal cleavage/methylation domain-containing protein
MILMKRTLGFTLIELLIVVAIIAILAAIAVPNFLEAQTRAKVTQVKADMRTIVTALETYHVDNNSYPNPRFPNPVPNDGSFSLGAWFIIRECRNGSRDGVGVQLTTPIEYISSSGLPLDPFMTHHELTSMQNYCGAGGIAKGGFWYAADLAQTLNFGIEGIWYTDISYWLQSPGPNLLLFGWDETSAVYDPSNGTISGGDIWYLGGKGPGFLPHNL